MLSLHLSIHTISKVQKFENLFVIEDIKPTSFELQLMRLSQKTEKNPFAIQTDKYKSSVQLVTIYYPVLNNLNRITRNNLPTVYTIIRMANLLKA